MNLNNLPLPILNKILSYIEDINDFKTLQLISKQFYIITKDKILKYKSRDLYLEIIYQGYQEKYKLIYHTKENNIYSHYKKVLGIYNKNIILNNILIHFNNFFIRNYYDFTLLLLFNKKINKIVIYESSIHIPFSSVNKINPLINNINNIRNQIDLFSDNVKNVKKTILITSPNYTQPIYCNKIYLLINTNVFLNIFLNSFLNTKSHVNIIKIEFQQGFQEKLLLEILIQLIILHKKGIKINIVFNEIITFTYNSHKTFYNIINILENFKKIDVPNNLFNKVNIKIKNNVNEFIKVINKYTNTLIIEFILKDEDSLIVIDNIKFLTIKGEYRNIFIKNNLEYLSIQTPYYLKYIYNLKTYQDLEVYLNNISRFHDLDDYFHLSEYRNVYSLKNRYLLELFMNKYYFYSINTLNLIITSPYFNVEYLENRKINKLIIDYKSKCLPTFLITSSICSILIINTIFKKIKFNKTSFNFDYFKQTSPFTYIWYNG